MNSCFASRKVLVLAAAQSATELLVLLGEAQASPVPKSILYQLGTVFDCDRPSPPNVD